MRSCLHWWGIFMPIPIACSYLISRHSCQVHQQWLEVQLSLSPFPDDISYPNIALLFHTWGYPRHDGGTSVQYLGVVSGVQNYCRRRVLILYKLGRLYIDHPFLLKWNSRFLLLWQQQHLVLIGHHADWLHLWLEVNLDVYCLSYGLQGSTKKVLSSSKLSCKIAQRLGGSGCYCDSKLLLIVIMSCTVFNTLKPKFGASIDTTVGTCHLIVIFSFTSIY